MRPSRDVPPDADSGDSHAGSQRSGALHDEGDPLPHPDAHRARRVAATLLVQLVDRGRDQPSAARPERVSERDGAAVGIHARIEDSAPP